jgi:hypothetical protein
MRYALLTAPFLAFFAGASASYGMFASNPAILFSFIYIIPLGISVALVASGLADLDKLENENAKLREQFELLSNRPEIIGASINGLRDFARAALAGSGEK